MKLSAPVYQLKRRARTLSRQTGVPLNQALDRIARQEGFNSWSLLSARASSISHATGLLARLTQGDLLLLAARPGHGKTLMGLKLIAEAGKLGRQGIFFTLEYSQADVMSRFRTIGGDPSGAAGEIEFDNSDGINADYIINRLASAPPGTVVVVDYLQLLDQKRSNPELMVQISRLRSFAQKNGLIMVFISQVDRSYDDTVKPYPDLGDVRLPNPLDLKLFDKSCFLNNGTMRFQDINQTSP